MELRMVIHKYLYLLAVLVKEVSCSCINSHWVLLKLHAVCALVLHLHSASHQSTDVKSCDCDWQQSNWSEYRETSAHVVRDDECLVAFLCRELAQSALA